MAPTAVDDRPRVDLEVRSPAIELAIVISRPSRIQATPRATTIRVWNGVHRRRSTLAGMTLRIAPPAVRVALDMAAAPLLAYVSTVISLITWHTVRTGSLPGSACARRAGRVYCIRYPARPPARRTRSRRRRWQSSL